MRRRPGDPPRGRPFRGTPQPQPEIEKELTAPVWVREDDPGRHKLERDLENALKHPSILVKILREQISCLPESRWHLASDTAIEMLREEQRWERSTSVEEREIEESRRPYPPEYIMTACGRKIVLRKYAQDSPSDRLPQCEECERLAKGGDSEAPAEVP